MWGKHIILYLLTIIFLLSLVIYTFSLNNLQFVPLISLVSVIIGGFVTGVINLILEDNRYKINRDNLISSIRAKNALNDAIARAIIKGLQDEIDSIDHYAKVTMKDNIDFEKIFSSFESIIINDLEPLDEVMDDFKLLVNEESRLLPIIAMEIKFINKSIKIRQDQILQRSSFETVRLRDENLIHSLNSLRKSIRNYEIDIYGKFVRKISIEELGNIMKGQDSDERFRIRVND